MNWAPARVYDIHQLCLWVSLHVSTPQKLWGGIHVEFDAVAALVRLLVDVGAAPTERSGLSHTHIRGKTDHNSVNGVSLVMMS